jgi:cell division protein FtsZ
MLSTTGPVKITRSDLHSVLGKQGAVTHYGFGKAEGPNRLHEALEKALRSPLLTLPGKGSALKDSPMILLLLRGAKDVSFAEVQSVVGEIERIAGENCQIKVGVHPDGSPGSALEIHLLASSGGVVRKLAREHEVAVSKETEKPDRPVIGISETGVVGNPSDFSGHGSGEGTLFPAPTKVGINAGKKSINTSKQTQGTLDLDTVQRGRFDKSEPTIVAGEDLDVPTFLRKGIKLNPPVRK